MSKSILTVTVNPALDRIVTVDRLVFEDRAYIESTTEAAGGRGINAARVLTAFGALATAVTLSGGETGRKFEEYLQADQFGKEVVKIRSGIRTNLTISDRQGLSVKLNERGPTISELEQSRLKVSLANAGFNSPYATDWYLAIKLASLIGGLLGTMIPPSILAIGDTNLIATAGCAWAAMIIARLFRFC